MKSLILLTVLSSIAFAQAPAAKSGAAPKAGAPKAAAAKAPATKAAAASTAASPAKLMNPAAWTKKAPAEFKARFTTTKGDFVIQVHRDWAPLGADRFYNLVRSNYYKDAAFFRVLSGFVVQWGMAANPKVEAVWSKANIKDDPVTQSNTKGRVTFAMAGPGTRTTQVFINLGNNVGLDKMAPFAPFGEVVEGMEVVSSLYSGYGEGAPQGNGPSQDKIAQLGKAYLDKSFPNLDTIKNTAVEGETAGSEPAPAAAKPKPAAGAAKPKPAAPKAAPAK